MRLELQCVKKRFNKQKIFNDVSFEFKESGLYSLVGASGCGKTTLLNILSLIDLEYEGKYFIDGIDAKRYKENERQSLKAKNFGYVFQNFNLFDDDTVLNNVKIILDSCVNANDEFKKRKIEEVLNILGIAELKDQYVKNLSGGEKQRVAIARTLVTSPNVIFCDEPTGALDNENSQKIFSLLKNLSKDILIICVTHDVSLAEKYSDYIIEIKAKKIELIKSLNKVQDTQISLMKMSNKKNKASLKLSFIFSHLKSKFKAKKIRNLIRNFLLSIALLTTGLSLSLTTGIHNSVANSFASLIDQNSVVMTKKDCKNIIFDYYSSGKVDIVRMLNMYKDELDYYGVNYLVDYENYFPDENDLYLLKSGKISKINGFNSRMFNEFILTPNITSLESYPKLTNELKNDEIVLSINYEQMKQICLELHIIRSLEELGKYLENNDVMVSLRVRNNSWQYNDEQIFRLKAVVLDSVNRIYHTNHLFNEFIFEESMRFPVTNRFNVPLKTPWTFKKIYYVHTKNFQSYFLNKILYDSNYKNFLFDSDNSIYSPLLCGYNTKSTNKVYVYNTFHDAIEIEKINQLNEIGFDFKNYYFSTNLGYFNNGTSLFTGFARPVFFSKNIDLIDKIIDAHSKVNEKEFLDIKVPDGVVDGYAFKPSSNNLRLKITDKNIKPNEIFISEGFNDLINTNEDFEGEIFASLLKESEGNGEIVKNTFETIKLNVKGVIQNDTSVSIYQNNEFSISLFRDFFKISSFNLIPTSIIFDIGKKLGEKELNELENVLPNYEFINPILQIEKSIEDSTSFLKYILISFSLIAIVSSLILMFIVTLINAIESRKEIAILTVLGFEKIEILKIFIIDNLFNSISSYFVSTVSLVFVSLFVGKVLGDSLGLTGFQLTSPLSIVINLFITMVIALFGTIGSIFEIKNIKLSENLH